MKRFLYSIVVTSVLVSLFASSTTAAEKKILKVYFLDVGQGDAVYIKTPNGDDILIDGGSDKYGDIVVANLKAFGVDDIELMIATNPDTDHVGGLDNVLEAFKVESVYSPKVSQTTQTYKDFIAAVNKEKLTIKEAKAGIKLPFKDIKAAFVGPVKAYAKNDYKNWSAVLRITYGNNSFLFMSDAEKKAEKDMIKSKQQLKADVVKIGNHGSGTSTSAEFIKAVSPKFAVISVAESQSNGYPKESTLNTLAKANVLSVLRTDLDGTIKFECDGDEIKYTAGDDVPDGVIAVYDDGIVTRAEFNRYLSFLIILQPLLENLVQIESVKQDYLKEYVAYRKFFLQIPESELEKAKVDVNSQLESALKSSPSLEETIEQKGLSIEEFKDLGHLRASVWNHLFNQVTESEIQETFDQKQNLYTQVSYREIIIALNELQAGKAYFYKRKEALERANKVKQLLDNGADWSESVKQYSDSSEESSNGGLHEDVFLKDKVYYFTYAMIHALNSLPIGEISDPLETPEGYVILVIDKRTRIAFVELSDKDKDDLKLMAAQEQFDHFANDMTDFVSTTSI